MGILALVVAVLLIVGFFAIPLLLERWGILKLKAPDGGWRRREPAERRDDDRPGGPGRGLGGGGSFGGGGASGGW